MDDRYIKNIGPLTAAEASAIRTKHVCVVGCGGLGGYVIEYLLRLGVGEITAVDGDVFCETNLNRQLFCTGENLGRSKVTTAKERAKSVNPQVCFNAVDAFLDSADAADIISHSDVVIDALDNVSSRRILFSACADGGKLLIHGAVDGWQVQAAVISPEMKAADIIYGGGSAEVNGTLSFVPAFCASIQTSQCVKILCGREAELLGKLLCADLSTGESHIIKLA